MTLLLPDSGLRALMILAPPRPPDTLLASLQSKASLSAEESRHLCEAELHTRLYFYDLLAKRDTSAFPAFVATELRENQLSCLALLLHVQWLMRPGGNVASIAKQLLGDDLGMLSAETREFVGAQMANLLLDGSDSALADMVNEAATVLQLQDDLRRIVELATTVVDFDARQPQATIATLRKLADQIDAAGAAALLLLARIYRHLSLPYEESQCYSQWVVGLARLHEKNLADLAGSICKSNPGMERAILDAASRWLQLLKASGAQQQVDEIIAEFRKAGYATQFEVLRGDSGRQPGYECRLISRDEVQRGAETHAMISGLLTTGVRSGACIIVREEAGADVDRLPRSAAPFPERELMTRLPDHLSKASVLVLTEIVEENVLQNRKWVICFDQTRPMDALAVGVLAMETELSVIYARAIIFDTRLDEAKNQNWFMAAVRLLAQPFDGQKLAEIRLAVRRVADQISAGHSHMQVIDL